MGVDIGDKIPADYTPLAPIPLVGLRGDGGTLATNDPLPDDMLWMPLLSGKGADWLPEWAKGLDVDTASGGTYYGKASFPLVAKIRAKASAPAGFTPITFGTGGEYGSGIDGPDVMIHLHVFMFGRGTTAAAAGATSLRSVATASFTRADGTTGSISSEGPSGPLSAFPDDVTFDLLVPGHGANGTFLFEVTIF